MPPSESDSAGPPANQYTQENLRKMADIIPAMIWMTDANAQCIFLNQAWLQFTGDELQRALGEGVLSAFHPDDRENTTRQYFDAVQRLETFAIEYRVRRFDGEYRWVLGVGSPRLDDQGRLLGYVGCVVDIHEQKQVEAALRQSEERLRELNETLEQQVIERTRQLSEREASLAILNQQLTRAEQKERLRLSQVLHDQAQQSLVATKMRIALAEMDATPETASELQAARTALDEAIETLRTLAVELYPPILHARGLGAGLEWLGGKMQRHHDLMVDLDIDFAAEPKNQLLRDLLFHTARELLLNVVKHAKIDRCELRLSKQQERIVLEVIDDGIGFDETSALSASEQSIGLFHIRERLRHANGELTIVTAPGQGTHITIEV